MTRLPHFDPVQPGQRDGFVEGEWAVLVAKKLHVQAMGVAHEFRSEKVERHLELLAGGVPFKLFAVPEAVAKRKRRQR